jgi:Zn-dependent membrane protease YugP
MATGLADSPTGFVLHSLGYSLTACEVAPSERCRWETSVAWGRHKSVGEIMIALGVILLILGFLLKISILWTIGIILLVVGAVLFLLGSVGRPVMGRRHFF